MNSNVSTVYVDIQVDNGMPIGIFSVAEGGT